MYHILFFPNSPLLVVNEWRFNWRSDSCEKARGREKKWDFNRMQMTKCRQMNRGSEVGIGITSEKEMIKKCIDTSMTQPPRKCALCRFLKSLCASHHFKNLQVNESSFFSFSWFFLLANSNSSNFKNSYYESKTKILQDLRRNLNLFWFYIVKYNI